MAIPQGYVKITPNTLYENVEYYIDTSIAPTIPIFTQLAFPYFGNLGGGGAEAIHGGIGAVTAVERGVYIGTKVVDSDRYVWNSNVVDGIVIGYPTLNIQCETSPDWLYIKAPEPQPVTKNVTITLDSGVESATFVFNEPENQLISFTVDGDSYQAELGMTWAEFCDSEFNTDGWYVGYGGEVIITDSGLTGNSYYVIYNENNLVIPNEIIFAGAYTTQLFNGGGSGN